MFSKQNAKFHCILASCWHGNVVLGDLKEKLLKTAHTHRQHGNEQAGEVSENADVTLRFAHYIVIQQWRSTVLCLCYWVDSVYSVSIRKITPSLHSAKTHPVHAPDNQIILDHVLLCRLHPVVLVSERGGWPPLVFGHQRVELRQGE